MSLWIPWRNVIWLLSGRKGSRRLGDTPNRPRDAARHEERKEPREHDPGAPSREDRRPERPADASGTQEDDGFATGGSCGEPQIPSPHPHGSLGWPTRRDVHSRGVRKEKRGRLTPDSRQDFAICLSDLTEVVRRLRWLFCDQLGLSSKGRNRLALDRPVHEDSSHAERGGKARDDGGGDGEEQTPTKRRLPP